MRRGLGLPAGGRRAPAERPPGAVPRPARHPGAVLAEDPKQLEDWSTLLGIREQVLKALEEARNAKQIGKGLEAQVKLAAADPVYSVLSRSIADQLRYLFIVSAVTLEQKASGNGNASGF